MTYTYIFLSLIIFISSSCSYLPSIPFLSGGDESSESETTSSESHTLRASDQMILAVGGNYPGIDERIITDSSGDAISTSHTSLNCQTEESHIVDISSRPGFDTIATGQGFLITPLSTGIADIHCETTDGQVDQWYQVTVPPQQLIQILIAEALGPIVDDAQTVSESGASYVLQTSDSMTAHMIGMVIKNRIALILDNDQPSLFGVDDELFYENPPESYWNAVIAADNQFSPTNSDNIMNDVFVGARHRGNMMDAELIAYDQAVISAGRIFNNDYEDITQGAFAFMSPSDAQWNDIEDSLENGGQLIPASVSFNDSAFPALAPIQLVIDSAIWQYDSGRPAFIFARTRLEDESAIIEN